MPSVELFSLSCNHCGAPLEVPASARFLTCRHCGSRLEVVTNGDAAWTVVQAQVAQIAERQDEMANDLEIIRLQNELERLDREWDSYRRGHLHRDKHGNEQEPSTAGGMMMMAIGIVGGLFFFGMTSAAGAPMLFRLVGLVFAAFGFFGGILAIQRGKAYEGSQQRYRHERRQLERRLERIDQP